MTHSLPPPQALHLDHLAAAYDFEYEAEFIPSRRHRLQVLARIRKPVLEGEAQSIGKHIQAIVTGVMKCDAPTIRLEYTPLDLGVLEVVPRGQ